MSIDQPLHPPPPPPPPPGPPPPAAAKVPSKKKLYQAIAAGKTPVEGDHADARLLLTQRESRLKNIQNRLFAGTQMSAWEYRAQYSSLSAPCTILKKDLQWILFNKYIPSLIQDGPQCGLVALWMAAHLRNPPLHVSMETVVQTAMDRGYTAQGEMFSAHDMALLAEEVCVCRVELLSGGMGGDNMGTILTHLCEGQPVLIPDPYDEDLNHEPCRRSGHRAHWAVASGVLLGLAQGTINKEHTEPDPTLPWLLLPRVRSLPCRPTSGLREAYILAKQGKSLRYQLWSLDSLVQSNDQLREMAPQRAGDGTAYVVPQEGVEAGLAGQVVLLHTGSQG